MAFGWNVVFAALLFLFGEFEPMFAQRWPLKVAFNDAGGLRRGSLVTLNGVPIAVKDLCNTEGVATAAGMAIHRSNVPSRDATVVRRLRDAGAVILGKLQMTEGAFGSHHPSIDPPVNPWHAAYWTGVSSSGSGVATAAGLCFASLGSDTGGSIRGPAGLCGLAGLKPTYGLVSRAGVLPNDRLVQINGETTKDLTLGDALKKLRGAPGTNTGTPLAFIPGMGDAFIGGGYQIHTRNIRQPDGTWQINGCALVKAKDMSA